MSNKILVIGDIHGRTDWEKIVMEALPKFYHIVFVGDYVDSFHLKPAEILYNLKKIVGYKKKYKDRITLLLGNHDYAYIDNHFNTSGYQMHASFDYQDFFKKNYDLFQVAYGFTNDITQRYTLITHAGLTKTYYNNYILPLIENEEGYLYKVTNGKCADMKLHKILNFMRDDKILWKVGSERGGMGTPGPLWAHQSELLEDHYPGINQVYGHTAMDTVVIKMSKGDLLIKVDGSMSKCTPSVLIDL